MNDKKPSILYVDDEINNLNAFKATFRRDFQVVTAISPKDAYPLLEEQEFEVIISDERMPEVSGAEFFKSILHSHPKPIRMLLTGYADIDSVIRAINEGRIYRYITKPWDEQDLKMTIENAVAFYRAQNEIEAKNAALNEAYQELERFVYSASHDLRAPLASVLGITKIALMEDNPAAYRDYMGKIQTSIGRLDDFIQNIIKYYRSVHTLEDITATDIHFNEMIAHIIENLAHYEQAQKIQFEISVEDSLNFKGDKTRIQVIISNLITNAIKFQKTPVESGQISIYIRKSNQQLEIEVKDNGIGMDLDAHKDVFQLFKRALREKGSTGIGLYIVQETVRKLSGKLFVESEVGIGSTFRVLIPYQS
jgi:signal transduction histidine kinase